MYKRFPINKFVKISKENPQEIYKKIKIWTKWRDTSLIDDIKWLYFLPIVIDSPNLDKYLMRKKEWLRKLFFYWHVAILGGLLPCTCFFWLHTLWNGPKFITFSNFISNVVLYGLLLASRLKLSNERPTPTTSPTPCHV